MTLVHSVNVYSWNPGRNALPFFERYPIGPRINNFGDLLGPIVAKAILRNNRVPLVPRTVARRGMVLAVGSVMHKGHDGDIVWGTGVNGKVALSTHRFTHLDIRAVRGPRSRAWLAENKGLESPEIYGDPALLMPQLYPKLAMAAQKKTRKLAVVPNLNEAADYRSHPDFIDPQWPLWKVLTAIAQSERVVGSSLHGLVIAEALGIPAGLIASTAEPPFKYQDYFEGTGRTPAEYRLFEDFESADRFATAIDIESYHPLAAWDPAPLLNAFPLDRWGR